MYWCNIINDGYNEEVYDIEKAKKLLTNHYLFDELETFFICDSGVPIGTISMGKYKSMPSTGGDCRIAVLPAYRGKNLGLILLNFAILKLKERGYSTFITLIASKRKTSVFMHFRCGFKPMKNNYFVAHGAKLLVLRLLYGRRLRLITNAYYNEYLAKYNAK